MGLRLAAAGKSGSGVGSRGNGTGLQIGAGCRIETGLKCE